MTLHHHTYDRLGDELLSDLRALCWPHHKALHRHAKRNGCSLLEAFDAVSGGAEA